jgi:hypothetical protein
LGLLQPGLLPRQLHPAVLYDVDCCGKARTFQFFEKCLRGPPHTDLRIPITAVGIALLAGLSVAPAQQGTADAIVAKIPAANIPSTVTLSTSGGNGVPGQAVTIALTLAPGGATAPASFQIDLSFDPTMLTFVSASAGAQLASAGEGLSSTAISSGDVRLSTTGANQNAIPAGVVAYASFTLSSSFGATGTPVNLVNCMSSGPLGNPLSTGCTAGTIGFTCAITGDASAGVADVQAIIDQALGVSPAVNDMNRDGVVNVADVQKVIGAALGQGCVY